ncbi:nucleotidyltransferase domain-containing protein [Lamprobacter modestohalophilus]|nr:nucleotidyltransferase domain-containing protein [Lamprobacter modestohalophilus]
MIEAAEDGLARCPGSVVRKHIRNGVYVYFQYRSLEGRTRQLYLGPDNEATEARTQRLRELAAARAEQRDSTQAIAAAFLAAGGFRTEHAPMRVLRAFSDAGVLRPGSARPVLIGTHAFHALGNLLGVRWDSPMQTQDMDLAADADVDVDLAIPPDMPGISSTLEQLEMGFLPVPALDLRAPSTSFKVRGQSLRVNLLTPLVGPARAQSDFVLALGGTAQPLRFLDYLIEAPVPALLLSHRDLVLTNVPDPARFAWHKLLVSEERPLAQAAKRAKDRMQVAQLLAVLREEAPAQLAAARAELEARGRGWAQRLERALAQAQSV